PAQTAAVDAYVEKVKSERDIDRAAKTEKTGVFTGGYAINPVNNEKIPIWVADYVMMGYGTGAIMAVPAHDQRDFEFARKFGLQIRVVVRPMRVDSFMLLLPSEDILSLTEDQLFERYIQQPE